MKELEVPVLYLSISGDEPDETFDSLVIDYNELVTGVPTLTRQEEYSIMKKYEMIIPLHFNFGYAITVWKAQGSEWGKVLLFSEPGWPKQPKDRIKYLYTGITRAADRIVVAT